MSLADLPFFLREAIKGLKFHWTANVISVVCIFLALLSLSFLVTGWANLEHLLERARDEAEIVVYLREEATSDEAESLAAQLLTRPGVETADPVTPEETASRIQDLLGSEIDILEVLEGQNPFTYSVAVGVTPEQAPEVARFAMGLPGVEAVRDNEEILTPLARITALVRWAGTVVTLAVGLVSVALVSHIVRLGISARQREIETFRLLGASEWFVSTPFILEGALLGLAGSALCLATTVLAGPALYELLETSLPFFPLADWGSVLGSLSLLVLALGFGAGILGAAVSLRTG